MSCEATHRDINIHIPYTSSYLHLCVSVCVLVDRVQNNGYPGFSLCVRVRVLWY